MQGVQENNGSAIYDPSATLADEIVNPCKEGLVIHFTTVTVASEGKKKKKKKKAASAFSCRNPLGRTVGLRGGKRNELRKEGREKRKEKNIVLSPVGISQKQTPRHPTSWVIVTAREKLMG